MAMSRTLFFGRIGTVGKDADQKLTEEVSMKHIIIALIALLVGTVGCSSPKVKKETPLLGVQFETQQEKDVREAIIALRRVHFEYDSSNLSTQARVALADAATKLWRYDDLQLVVEGHADNRGTDEYNIALGERRARAAARYLNRMGLKESQLTRISFGAEMPLAEGEDEIAYSINRRVDFQVFKGDVKLLLVDDKIVKLPLIAAR